MGGKEFKPQIYETSLKCAVRRCNIYQNKRRN
jgi:hypothetical protein